jgi:hypothetical protein
MSGKRTALKLKPIPIHQAKIDRTSLMIRDTVAMQVGEARGHRLWADNKTLHTMAALGNQASLGIKGRMGHPGMSDNAFAREVMRASNFRVMGDRLVHDVSFYDWAKKSPAFSQDPVNYIFDRAEQNPESFGESVVIWTDEFWVKADGTELDADLHDRPDDAIYEYPSMRPKEFYYVDFVTDGALTPNGLFSAENDFWRSLFAGTSGDHAEKAFLLLHDFQQQFRISDEDLAHKVPALLNNYKYWKGFQVEKDTSPEVVEAENSDALSAALADADSVLSAVESQSEEKPVATTPLAESLPRSEFEALQAEVTALKNQLSASQEALNKTRQDMAAYVQRMNAAMSLMQKQIAKLAAEPIESNSVPLGGTAMFSQTAPSPAPAFATVAVPASFDAVAATAFAGGSPLPMNLAEIEAMPDPALKAKAIEEFNKRSNPNPFGFAAKN